MIPRKGLLWGAGVGTTALLGGGWWYFRPELAKQAAMIQEIPAIHDSMNAVSQRVQQVEGQFQSWANDREGLLDRMTKLEGLLGTELAVQKRQLLHMSDSIMARVRMELAQHDARTNSRLANWETQREEDRAAIADMRQQMADLGKTVALQQTRLAAMESNASADKQVVERQVESIRDDANQQRGDLRELARSLEPRRIDFEASRNHSQNLVPGVSLCVTGVDVAHRRVNGWMWIMPDRKTIWLRGQGALQPVVYYSAADGKRREIVFTHVTRDGAVGYMLLPADTREVAMIRSRP